jgi:pectate lyase
MASADNGGPFTSHTDQADRGEIHLNSNTTLIGVGSTAKIVNGVTKVYHINNVIIRNIAFVNPCDVTPVWDPSDGATGNWNSEFDAVVVDGSKNVWLDHLSFTDAPLTDDKLPVQNGHTKQCHDGSMDIKNGADFVTVSASIFELHDKNNLVGAGDGKTTDEGHLAITFRDNLWRDITQRAPRVRFGKVHLFNNYFVGSKTHPIYPNIYSVGVGKAAKIISENNAFEIAGATKCNDIVVNPLSTSPVGNFKDAGSTLNGTVLSACSVPSNVTWTIPYAYTKLATAAVKANVLANAGVGKIGF